MLLRWTAALLPTARVTSSKLRPSAAVPRIRAWTMRAHRDVLAAAQHSRLHGAGNAATNQVPSSMRVLLTRQCPVQFSLWQVTGQHT
jgi:hypothetical protein